MPLHDWTRVPAGLFHHFHQDWSIEIVRELNRGLLPPGTIALVEQRSGPVEADLLAIETRATASRRGAPAGGIALQEPPNASLMLKTDRPIYAARANRIVIRHHLGRIIAVIEILSPGNKDSRGALHRLVDKTVDLLADGIHVLLVDLFPPTPRDPLGIHKLIWDELADEEQPFAFPPGKDRVVVSYEKGVNLAAYVETVGLGDLLPDPPLFLTRDLAPNLFVRVPLERTYRVTWDALPQELRTAVETGVLPAPEA